MAWPPFAPSLPEEVMQAPSLAWAGQQGPSSLACGACLQMTWKTQEADSAHLASDSDMPARLHCGRCMISYQFAVAHSCIPLDTERAGNTQEHIECGHVLNQLLDSVYAPESRKIQWLRHLPVGKSIQVVSS